MVYVFIFLKKSEIKIMTDNLFKNKYRNKTVLVTGHTGFKGSWLSIWLSYLGAKVVGLSNSIPTNPSCFECTKISDKIIDERIDITDFKNVLKIFNKHKPDYVFHLAAQALVRPSYENPLDTFSTNAIGTATLMEVLRNYNMPIIAVIMKQTDWEEKILIVLPKAWQNLQFIAI